MAVELLLQRYDNALKAGGSLLHDIACHLHTHTCTRTLNLVNVSCVGSGVHVAYSVDVGVVQSRINLIQYKEWSRLIAV